MKLQTDDAGGGGGGGGGGGAAAAAEAVVVVVVGGSGGGGAIGGGGDFDGDDELATERTAARTESHEVSEVVHSQLGEEDANLFNTGEWRAQGQTIARLFLDAATGNATEKRNKAVEGLAAYIRTSVENRP